MKFLRVRRNKLPFASIAAAFFSVAVLLFGGGCVPSSAAPADCDVTLCLVPEIERLPTPKQSSMPECGVCGLYAILGYYNDLEGTDRLGLFRALETDLNGTKSSKMADFAKGRGYDVELFSGSLDDVVSCVDAGVPFVVGVVTGIKRAAGTVEVYHYKVVVGYAKDRNDVTALVTYNPSTGGFEYELVGRFLESWDYFAARLDEARIELDGMGVDTGAGLSVEEISALPGYARRLLSEYEKFKSKRKVALNLMLVILPGNGRTIEGEEPVE